MGHISFIEWVDFDLVQEQQCKHSSANVREEKKKKKISVGTKAEQGGLCAFRKARETTLSGFSYTFVFLGLARF